MSAHVRCIDVARCVPRAISERHFIIPSKRKRQKRGLLHRHGGERRREKPDATTRVHFCAREKTTKKKCDAKTSSGKAYHGDEMTMMPCCRVVRVVGINVERVRRFFFLGDLFFKTKPKCLGFKKEQNENGRKKGREKKEGKHTCVFGEPIQIPLSSLTF